MKAERSERHCHPERAKQAQKKPKYDSEHPPKAGDEGVFYGPFVRLVDGDTLRQLTRGPGQQLVLVFDDVDRYGRIVAQAWIGNSNVNEEMVQRGAAWSESVGSTRASSCTPA